MPHIVKKSYLTYYLGFCLLVPLFYISGDDVPFVRPNVNTVINATATVTTTLTSSVSSNTFCSGDSVTFTASPNDGNNYRFYINGILKQGPSGSAVFRPTNTLFDGDKITVTLEKGGGTGNASLILIENKIDDPGKIFFRGESDALVQKTVCHGSTSLHLESFSSARIRGSVLSDNDNRYQWMSSPDNRTWTAIVGANLRNYSLPRMTETIFLRRDIVSDLNGTVCRTPSNILRVEVEVELKGGTVLEWLITSLSGLKPKSILLLFLKYLSLLISVDSRETKGVFSSFYKQRIIKKAPPNK